MVDIGSVFLKIVTRHFSFKETSYGRHTCDGGLVLAGGDRDL